MTRRQGSAPRRTTELSANASPRDTDGTQPTSRPLAIALRIALAIVVVGFVVYSVRAQWGRIGDSLHNLHPQWPGVVGASAIVFGAYVILIQTWRLMLGSWGTHLSFGDAATVWFVSNLGKYIPGKIWQITAMGAMAQKRGASAAGALGSALIVNLVNVITGFVVVFATGIETLRIGRANGPLAAVVLTIVLAVSIAAMPLVIPVAARAAARLLKRPIADVRIPARALWLAALGTTAAWLMYGIAFWMITHALLGDGATGGVLSYIAAYTSSYLVGYLAFFLPGGVGAREAMLQEGMPALGLVASGADAFVVAWTSRLWLTVLEVVPGLLLMAFNSLRRRPRP